MGSKGSLEVVECIPLLRFLDANFETAFAEDPVTAHVGS